MNILFICTGNTCRSPMAEGILNNAVLSDGVLAGRVTAVSAGIASNEDEPASMNSVSVLKDEYGIDISSYRSRRISKECVDSADLVLAMTRAHKDKVISMFPGIAHKVFTLKEYAVKSCDDMLAEEYDFSLDIQDPFGMPQVVYKHCAADIKNAVDRLVEKLRTLLE